MSFKGSVVLLACSVTCLLIGVLLELSFVGGLANFGLAYTFAISGIGLASAGSIVGAFGLWQKKKLALCTLTVAMLALLAAATEAFARGGIPDVRAESAFCFWCSVAGVAADVGAACFAFAAAFIASLE